MENKKVGWLLLGIAFLVGVMLWQFNAALENVSGNQCGVEDCPYHHVVAQQQWISFALVGVIVVVALVLMVSKPDERIVVRKVKERVRKKEYDLSGLTADELKAFAVVREKKAVFQAALLEELEFGKAKMTRVVDRLEGRGLVERKRRGMTNVVVLKE